MTEVLEQNRQYAEILKRTLMLRHEPVAVKLIKEGEEWPTGLERPEKQMSHCQAMFAAEEGASLKMMASDEQCHVGASALGMMSTPEKVTTGEFHGKIGIHEGTESAKEMIDSRLVIPDKIEGEAICPLKDADFIPDVVEVTDVPERLFWLVSAELAEGGGRMNFSTAPFQCTCEDVTVIPIMTQKPNMSLGCFGCRRKTNMGVDELCFGFPYSKVSGYTKHLETFETGIMTRAKRS